VKWWFTNVVEFLTPPYPWANRVVPRPIATLPPLHVVCSSSEHLLSSMNSLRSLQQTLA